MPQELEAMLEELAFMLDELPAELEIILDELA